MSGFKGVLKDGWHPKGKDGQKESWRGDFKGINQVAGWMGKGKDKDNDRAEHVARPLSSLKDPAAFGPPPKHIKYHGTAAVSNQTSPDRRGFGTPISQEQAHQPNFRQQEPTEAEAESQKPAPPPLPYRANRTGVDPSTLPPPPVRRTGSPADSAASETQPSVPPRIPPRINSTPQSHPPTPPPAYSPPSATEQSSDGYLNQGATSRLAQAGVSVPALGIGSRGDSLVATGGSIGQAPVNELQTRFSQMRTSSASRSQVPPPPPARGNLSGRSPSPGSTLNVQSATSAIKDFREKHDDKIQAGKQKLSGFNEKYGISQRVNGLFDSRKDSTHSSQAPPLPPHPSVSRTPSNTESESLGGKKAPPPPPPKKAGMRSTPVTAPPPTPPPVPVGTKPR
ncbi:hypothetical protein BDV28DRAFT_145595 [Aspergillus coremiiformis]|uniref:Altered inheritance of mitochondria protein 3 n=1 Tax=Aspergillus coremiiformis TaxID=138285 RepID=A0A5N6ZE66_9EURO|nr:hypothetical protein BDV28DRAFT_145595 [Aspergillus coremiiformis]